jgi:uncharacterized protein (TIGR02594 family)
MPLNRLSKDYRPNPRTKPLGTYVGFVKDNNDAQRMGRLSVYIPELGGDPNDPTSWILVSYASPFAGATDPNKISGSSTTMEGSQQSYGLWMIPPDINNEVAVFFANSDIARGYWFACMYQTNMNHMVPGIATNITTEPGPPPKTGPVVEYNKINVGSVDSPQRPRFTPLSSGLSNEGLMGDNERGSASTSARRESPSKVFGLLSPRGNTIHIDDNAENEFIRMRTRSGAQILIHETTGYVYINSKNGSSWMEISDAGVDVYTQFSVSMHAEQDFNIRADRNIILDANANIFMRAGEKITMQAGTDVQIGAAKNLILSAGVDGSINVAGDLQAKAGKNLRLESAADTTQKAGGKQIRAGSTIFDNSNGAPGATANDATGPTGADLLNTTSTRVGSAPLSWKYGGGKINSIVSRMPTHEPWGGHPNSKVPPPPLEDNPPPDLGPQGSGNASNIGPDGQLMNDDGCGFGVASTKPISTTNYNAITSAADRVGVPQSTMLAFSDIESSHMAGVGASSSSAKGLYQFTSGTWSSMVTQYGNLYNVSSDPNTIYDPNANALMGAQFVKNNMNVLQQHGIANPTPGQLYAMHLMGQSGGVSLISAAQSSPDKDASLLFPAAAAANPNLFKGKTVGQVYDNLQSLANGKAAAYADQQGQPAPCSRAGALQAANSTSGVSGNNSSPTSTGSGYLPPGSPPAGSSPEQVKAFLAANGSTLDPSRNNWCAAYVGASLNASGTQGTGSNVATSYLNWGQPITGQVQQGDVVVLANGHAAGEVGGHVGIATGVVRSDGAIQIVQGNYGNKVAYSYEKPASVSVRRANSST